MCNNITSGTHTLCSNRHNTVRCKVACRVACLYINKGWDITWCKVNTQIQDITTEWVDIHRMMDRKEGIIIQVTAATTKAEATIVEAVENRWLVKVSILENTERSPTKMWVIKLKMAATINHHSKLNKGNQRTHLLNQMAGFHPRVQ